MYSNRTDIIKKGVFGTLDSETPFNSINPIELKYFSIKNSFGTAFVINLYV